MNYATQGRKFEQGYGKKWPSCKNRLKIKAHKHSLVINMVHVKMLYDLRVDYQYEAESVSN